MDLSARWKEHSLYPELCRGSWSHPPFLFRNMRYVRENRRDAEDEDCQYRKVGPLLRVRPDDIPAPPGTNIRLWLVASQVQDCIQKQVPLGLAVRDFRLQSTGNSPSDVRLVPSSCAIDLSLASAYSASHELRLRLEVCALSGGWDCSTPPLLVGETVLHCDGFCSCAQHSLREIELRPPAPEHELPRAGFLLSDMPAIADVVAGTSSGWSHRATECCDVDQSDRRWESRSHCARVEGLSLRSLEIDSAEAEGELIPREAAGDSKPCSGSRKPGCAPDGVYATLEMEVDPVDGQCALSYQGDRIEPLSLQVYTPSISPSIPGFVRPDFVCPLCLRFCRRLSTMLGHFESYHETLYPSLVIIPVNDANVRCSWDWMRADPMIILHFTLTERQPSARMLSGMMPSSNAEDCTDTNQKHLAQRRNLEQPKVSKWISTEDGTAVSADLAPVGSARDVAPSSSSEIERPSGLEGSRVLFVNTTRFPSWHVPLIDWDAVIGKDRTKLGKVEHSVATRARDFKLSTKLATKNRLDQVQDADSDSTLVEEERMSALKRVWSRCQQCHALHAAAYAYNPDFCCQTCEMRHASNRRLSAASVSVEQLLDNPPLSNLASSGNAQRSTVAFANVFRNKTMFHLVSMARFDAEHFFESDGDSEAEVDFSWRRQLNVEEIDMLAVRPKQKVLWTMWNRFAFDRMAAGEYADRYTRYSLELFATLYRSEILRLGLRIELMAFIRALHVHGCIDGTAVISTLKCLDGQKSVLECSESMLPKGIDVEGLKEKRAKVRVTGRKKQKKGKRT